MIHDHTSDLFMNHVLNIPGGWAAALMAVRATCDEAVIAGGALRDLMLAGPVKDLDIFTRANTDPDTLAHRLVHHYGWKLMGTLAALNYLTGFRDEVRAVYTFNAPGVVIPVQVIFLHAPDDVPFWQSVISRMDFNLCRFSHNVWSCVGRQADFRDLNEGRFKLVLCEDFIQAERSMARAERFKERYPFATFDLALAERFPTPTCAPSDLG